LDWYPPDDYKPIRGVVAYLFRMEPPTPNSAEGKLLKMIVEWKSADQVGMTPEMSRCLIDRRLVPMAIYPNLVLSLRRYINQ